MRDGFILNMVKKIIMNSDGLKWNLKDSKRVLVSLVVPILHAISLNYNDRYVENFDTRTARKFEEPRNWRYSKEKPPSMSSCDLVTMKNLFVMNFIQRVHITSEIKRMVGLIESTGWKRCFQDALNVIKVKINNQPALIQTPQSKLELLQSAR